MTEIEFQEKISAVAAGDRNALREIYDEYLPYIYTVVYGVVGNKEDAEDLSADCFVRIWETAGRFKPGNGHKGYLATIARNMAIDFIRKKNREMPMDELPEDDSGGSPPTAGEDSNVNVISVRDAISTLSPPEQTIVNMKILSDMTFKEIAESLGQPIGTITWRYNEAIKKLRTILGSTA